MTERRTTTTREFPGTPEQVPVIRRWVDSQLTGCPIAADIALCVTEIVTNAINHTHSGQEGGMVQVTVRRDPGLARVEVKDQGAPTGPHIPSPNLDLEFDLDSDEEVQLIESGRGLRLVDELSTRWDVAGDEHDRTVAFEMEWNPDTDHGIPHQPRS